jgi:hypothetical protein
VWFRTWTEGTHTVVAGASKQTASRPDNVPLVRCARRYIRSWQIQRPERSGAVAIGSVLVGARAVGVGLSRNGLGKRKRSGGDSSSRRARVKPRDTRTGVRIRRRVERCRGLALQSRNMPSVGAVTSLLSGRATAPRRPHQRRQLHDRSGRRRFATGKCMSVCAPGLLAGRHGRKQLARLGRRLAHPRIAAGHGYAHLRRQPGDAVAA